MRIDVLNTMVVLVLRHLYSEKVIGQQLCHVSIPDSANFLTSDPLKPPKNLPMDTKFAQDRELWGPTYPPNLVFLGAPGTNRQGVGVY